VNRKFLRPHPDELWVSDVAEHPTREGRVYCAAVMAAHSRKIIGWLIDSRQDTTLVVNVLDMAIGNRRPALGDIAHTDHGTRFSSWVFGERRRAAGPMPSFGAVGDGLDKAMMESFRSPTAASAAQTIAARFTKRRMVHVEFAVVQHISVAHRLVTCQRKSCL
jgi:putative transposase